MGSIHTELKKTPLHKTHVALGARMMGFGGYDMPVQYSSIKEEHIAVRQTAGIFDVSHMGEVIVRGPSAFDFVQNLVTNDASRLYDGRAMYSAMCTPSGGIVDDLLVYRMSEQEYMLVINASNIEKDVAWMHENNPMKADLEDISDTIALFALQGPNAASIAKQIVQDDFSDLKYYHFRNLEDFFGCERAILSHTGYTGEKGFEIYCDADRASEIWEALMAAGKDYGLIPAGLGARDTLRIEAGYCLYGNDISDDTNPYEAGLGWITKPDKGEFVGRDALLDIKANGPDRKLVGFVMEERGIPRKDYDILNAVGDPIGTVTSGSQSPLLNCGIGMGYVPNESEYTAIDSKLGIAIRGRSIKARVKKPPFHKS